MYAKIILIGNLGSEPELKFLQSGTPVCNFRMATNRTWTKDGEKQEEVTWYRVAVFGPQAEPCNQYLSKGSQVLVEAESIKASAYMKDGEPAASLEVTARNVRFLSGNRTQGEPDDMDTAQVPF